jgi:hypothetical protein
MRDDYPVDDAGTLEYTSNPEVARGHVALVASGSDRMARRPGGKARDDAEGGYHDFIPPR